MNLESATHLVDATQNTDAYVQVSAALRGCMINMSKIANDLRLMASGPEQGLRKFRCQHVNRDHPSCQEK